MPFTAITIILGAVIMLIAVIKTITLRNLLASGPNASKWKWLVVLMIFFLAGYIVSIWLVINQNIDVLLMLTGLVFFMGAFFVLMVVSTTKSDVKSIEVSKNTLKEKNDQLEEANLQLDLFAHRISHDLKAPIASIRGLVNIAEKAASEEERILYFTKMKECTLNMDTFIKDVLDLSKNFAEVAIEKIDVRKMVQEVIEGLEYMDPERKTEIELNIQGECILSDSTRLKIILANLISNAYKYQDLKKEKLQIQISFAIQDNHFWFSVKDNGIGIEEEHLGKIFNIFYRGTEQSAGTGLGLHLVKEMLQKMNGNIEVRSTKNEGSEFIVVLPILK